MTLDHLIETLERLRQQYGNNTPVLVEDDDGYLHSLGNARGDTVSEDDDYPEDWNMPAGLEFIKITF